MFNLCYVSLVKAPYKIEDDGKEEEFKKRFRFGNPAEAEINDSELVVPREQDEEETSKWYIFKWCHEWMNEKQKEIKKKFYIKCKDYTEVEYEDMIKREENQDEIDEANW